MPPLLFLRLFGRAAVFRFGGAHDPVTRDAGDGRTTCERLARVASLNVCCEASYRSARSALRYDGARAWDQNRADTPTDGLNVKPVDGRRSCAFKFARAATCRRMP